MMPLVSGYSQSSISENIRREIKANYPKWVYAYVAGYIYNLWLDELGLSIETKAISPLQAVGLERDVRVYVRERVRLELGEQDPASIDWNGPAGRNIIDTVFQEAYGFLEVEQ